MRGSVYERANGKYTAVTEPVEGSNGKRTRRSLGTYTTKDAAERTLAEYNSRNQVVSVRDKWDDPLVADIALQWKSKQRLRCDAGAIARQTRKGYEGIIDVHVIPELGHERVSALTPDRLERYQLELHAMGLSDRTVVSIWQVLSMALKAARLGFNPCTAVDAPRIRSRKRTTRPTVEQVNAFLVHLQECPMCGPLHDVWRVAATTGLRRGELAGLAWEDIDLVKGRLTVSRSAGKDGEHFLKQPKSAVGARTIGLDPGTVQILSSLTGQRATLPKSSAFLKLIMGRDLVFRSPRTGGLLKPEQLSWHFKHQWQHAGLPPEVSLHGLRHSHGSALLLQGLPVTQVAARMGHDPRVLLSIYAGELDSESRQTAMAAAAESMYTTRTRH
jgi:integrase